MKKLIVFDLISTLINSGPRYIEAYIRVSNSYGHHVVPDRSQLSEALGEKNLKQIIADFSPEVRQDELNHFMRDCNSMCDRLLTESDWTEIIYPDTIPALKKLDDSGIEMGIFTGTREDVMMAQLYHHGLIKFFRPDMIEGKDNMRDGMMDSVSLKRAQLRRIKNNFMTRNGQAENIIIIGDSPAGFLAARSLDLSFIGIEREPKNGQQLQEIGANKIIASLKDVINHVPLSRLPVVSPEARLTP